MLLIVAALTACDNGGEQSVSLPMPQDTYVDVMVELTRLRRKPPSARGAPERERLADSMRAEILERHGVTPEDLLAFADVAGRDPTLMMGLSQAIAELGDSLEVRLSRAETAGDQGDSGADSADPPATEADSMEVTAPSAESDTPALPPRSNESAAPRPRFSVPADSAMPVEVDSPGRSLRRPPKTRPRP
jgi:hypothetical protein